jgi:hypothetical protein
LAWAVLGKKADSIKTVETKLKVQAKATQAPAAKWSEQTLTADGNTITEYLSPDGTVFAVSWRGIKQPDLSLLFGDYYQEYLNANSKRPKLHSRRPVLLKTSRLTVMKSGHMRDIRGLAVVPSLLPPGVHPEDLRR